MARLIDNRMTLELNPVVAGLPVIEFVDDGPGPNEVECVSLPRKMTGGARLDRSIEVFEWFEC